MAQRNSATPPDQHLPSPSDEGGPEQNRINKELSDLVDKVIKNRSLAPGVDPEDVRQDTLLSLLERAAAEEKKGSPIDNILGYAVRSAVNACLRTFRRKSPQQIDWDDTAGPTVPADQEIQVVDRDTLRTSWERAESELSLQQLTVFLLDKREVFERLSPSIVSRRRLADALGISGDRLIELRKRLPLEDKELAALLGVTTNRVHFLRYHVNSWLRRQKI